MFYIDARLQKQLDDVSIGQLPRNQMLGQIAEILDANQDVLLPLPDGPGEQDYVYDVIKILSTKTKRIWYITLHLTTFHADQLRILLPQDTAVITTWCKEYDRIASSATILWSMREFRDFLFEMNHTVFPLPDRLILNGSMAFEDSDIQRYWEEICLRLAITIPTVFLLDAAPNVQAIGNWLEMCRERTCRLMEAPSTGIPTLIPVFLDHDQTLIPLLQGKRIANKVKQTIKEHRPQSVEQNDFIPRLTALLRELSWFPSIIVMTDDDSCEEAWRRCPWQTDASINQSSEVRALLNAHPVLQHSSRLEAIGSRRAMTLSGQDHPAWEILAETVLGTGQCDCLFVSMERLHKLRISVKIIILLTTRQTTTPGNYQPIGLAYMRILRKLVGRPGQDAVGILLTTHTPDMDVVHLRNLLDSRPPPLISFFSTTLTQMPSVLTIKEWDFVTFAQKTLAAFQHNSPLEASYLEIFEALAMELPGARCASPRVMLELRGIHLDLTFQMHKLTGKTERQDRLILRDLEQKFAWLPCQSCIHQDECHRRGSKRFRTLIAEYHTFGKEIFGSAAFQRIEMERHLICLKELGFVDSLNCLLGAGKLAASISGSYSMLLPLCAWNKILPLDDPYLSHAAVAGFVEDQAWETIRFVKEFCTSELRMIYQKIELLIPLFDACMIRLGYQIQRPSLTRAAFVLAYNNSDDPDYVMRLAGVRPSEAARLLETSAHLTSRLRTGLKQLSDELPKNSDG